MSSKMMQQSGTQILQDQAVHADRIKNDEDRDMSLFAAGDTAAQGDLYIVGLKTMPKGSTRRERQLAEGNTQGSRHVHEDGELLNPTDPAMVARLIQEATGAVIDPKYIGPVFMGGNIRHPEHGDHVGYPTDLPCAVVFQRSLDREEREQRVRD